MHKQLRDELQQHSDNPQTTRPGDSSNQVLDSLLATAGGTDRPMEEEHPYAPAMITFGTYPIVLGLAILGVLMYWFFIR